MHLSRVLKALLYVITQRSFTIIPVSDYSYNISYFILQSDEVKRNHDLLSSMSNVIYCTCNHIMLSFMPRHHHHYHHHYDLKFLAYISSCIGVYAFIALTSCLMWNYSINNTFARRTNQPQAASSLFIIQMWMSHHFQINA